MNIHAAIIATAPNAPKTAIDALTTLIREPGGPGSKLTKQRLGHLIGQTSHESSGYVRVVENLYYKTPEHLYRTFKKYFRNVDHAAEYTRNPEKLGNHVYAGRNGNTEPGDGFRFRGAGYLQLTGRENFRIYGQIIGVDLEASPQLAQHPRTAWQIAIEYLDRRKKYGKTAFQWADEGSVEMVTQIVNGGFNGLADRQIRTAEALAALKGIPEALRRGDDGPAVLALQRALHEHGINAGPLDGDFGPRTETAVKAFQTSIANMATGIADHATLMRLGLRMGAD